MDEKKLLSTLGLPKTTWFLRNLPFQHLSQRLSPKQKKLFSDSIESFGIRVLATLKPTNTNIPMYEDESNKFEEIHFYAVKLTDWHKRKEIYRVFTQTIPYPLVILFYKKDQYDVVLAKYHKHINGINLSVEKIYQLNPETELEKYLEQLNFKNLNKLNLKSFYDSMIQILIDIELQENYQVELKESNKEDYLTRLKEIDEKISQLQRQASKETQMNQRLPLHMEMHRLKQEKEKMIKR